MNKHDVVINKLAKNETVYLLNDFEDWAVKFEGGKCYGKFKGGPVYEIDQSTKLVTDTFIERVEMTEKEFNEF